MARGKAKQKIDLDNLDTLAGLAGGHNPSSAVLAKCQELGLPTFLNPKQRKKAIAALQQNNRRAERRNRTVGHAYLRIEPVDDNAEREKRSDEESDFRRQRRLAREAEDLRFAKERLKQRQEAREDKAADEADHALAALAINHALEQFRSLTPPPPETEQPQPATAADEKPPLLATPPATKPTTTKPATNATTTAPAAAPKLNGWTLKPPPAETIKIPSMATAPKKKAKVGKKETKKEDDLRKMVAALQRQLFQNANWMIQMHSTMQQLATRHEQTHAALIYANRRIAALEKKAR